MRFVLVRLLASLAFGACFIGGCSDVDAPLDRVEVQVLVKDSFEQTGLEGAQVCEMGTAVPNCETTDTSGAATLRLPANQELSYSVEKEAYGSILYPVVTGSTSANLDSNMWSDESLTNVFTDLRSPYPFSNTGAIGLIITPRFAGATFELVNATGTSFYEDEEDNWRLDLEGTTLGGTGRRTAFGVGGFVEVPPGTFQVEIGGTAQDCAISVVGGAQRGWPGDAPNRVRVPVREGFFTRVVLLCPAPP